MNIESKLSLVTVDATETVKPALIKFFKFLIARLKTPFPLILSCEVSAPSKDT